MSSIEKKSARKKFYPIQSSDNLVLERLKDSSNTNSRLNTKEKLVPKQRHSEIDMLKCKLNMRKPELKLETKLKKLLEDPFKNQKSEMSNNFGDSKSSNRNKDKRRQSKFLPSNKNSNNLLHPYYNQLSSPNKVASRISSGRLSSGIKANRNGNDKNEMRSNGQRWDNSNFKIEIKEGSKKSDEALTAANKYVSSNKHRRGNNISSNKSSSRLKLKSSKKLSRLLREMNMTDKGRDISHEYINNHKINPQYKRESMPIFESHKKNYKVTFDSKVISPQKKKKLSKNRRFSNLESLHTSPDQKYDASSISKSFKHSDILPKREDQRIFLDMKKRYSESKKVSPNHSTKDINEQSKKIELKLKNYISNSNYTNLLDNAYSHKSVTNLADDKISKQSKLTRDNNDVVIINELKKSSKEELKSENSSNQIISKSIDIGKSNINNLVCDSFDRKRNSVLEHHSNFINMVKHPGNLKYFYNKFAGESKDKDNNNIINVNNLNKEDFRKSYNFDNVNLNLNLNTGPDNYNDNINKNFKAKSVMLNFDKIEESLIKLDKNNEQELIDLNFSINNHKENNNNFSNKLDKLNSSLVSEQISQQKRKTPKLPHSKYEKKDKKVSFLKTLFCCGTTTNK